MSYLKNDKSNLLITFIATFICTALFLTYSGCNEDLELNEPNALSIDASFNSISLLKSSNEKYQQINDAIEDFALIVAHSLQDREFREFYKSEAMKKFDGDFDILYSNVKDSYVGGKSLHDRISEIATDIKKSTELSFKTEFSSVDELISKVPKLQIAIPVNCEEWNTNSFIPPVACLNSEMKNKTVTHIKAYERDGKLKMMDKAIAPKNTAIVISINERLDENGNVRECYLVKTDSNIVNGAPKACWCGSPSGDPIASNCMCGVSNGCSCGVNCGCCVTTPPPIVLKKSLKFKRIMKIKNACWQDGNPWLEGDPEFYFEVYRYYNNSRQHLNRVYFACGANVSVKTDYNVTLLTINRSDYYNISLQLKEEDGGLLGSDDIVELGWSAPWLTLSDPPGNAYTFDELDTGQYYEGTSGNVNMFAIWENI